MDREDLGYSDFEDKLRRFPLNVRAISAKIKLSKNYSQHGNILKTIKKKLSIILFSSQADPREKIEFDVIDVAIKWMLHISSKQNGAGVFSIIL